MPFFTPAFDGGLPSLPARLRLHVPSPFWFWPSPEEPAETLPIARIGSLAVRMASGEADLKRLQRLRYQVFVKDGAARAGVWARLTRRDADGYDRSCRHLIVTDGEGASARTVGTYRLLDRAAAERCGGFYSAGEFDIGPLLASSPDARLLELGRSCVLSSHRGKRTIELLWQGIAACLDAGEYDAMMGCASFPTTDVDALRLPLSFLHHHARAEGPWAVSPRPERAARFTPMHARDIDARAALKALPPLIKGYLRVGAKFGTGAVVDHAFGTTDVFVILPVSGIDARYRNYFAATG